METNVKKNYTWKEHLIVHAHNINFFLVIWFFQNNLKLSTKESPVILYILKLGVV